MDQGPERHYQWGLVVVSVGIPRTIRLALLGCFRPQRVFISTPGNVFMVTGDRLTLRSFGVWLGCGCRT